MEMARERERRMDGWMDGCLMLCEGRRGPAAAEGVGERERGGWGLVEGR